MDKLKKEKKKERKWCYLIIYVQIKLIGKVHPFTGTEALYRPDGQ